MPYRTPNHALPSVEGLAQNLFNSGGGRSLEELKESKDTLNGAESQRLRTFCTSQVMDPQTDLDAFGTMAFFGQVDRLKEDIQRRFLKYGNLPENVQLEKVAEEIFNLRYGPNRTPIMNCILQARFLAPSLQAAHLEIARHIINTFAPVASKFNIVDIPDLAGTTALSHAISTKPTFDPEFALLLWKAGANINARNRYGATPAHEFCMVWKFNDPTVMSTAKKALEWFLAHGGDVEIADGDGMKPSKMINNPILAGLVPILNEHRERRKLREIDYKDVCLACGGHENLLQCSRCRRTKYCGPPKKCQLADWARHKKTCGGKATATGSGGQSSSPKPQPQGFNYLGVQLS